MSTCHVPRPILLTHTVLFSPIFFSCCHTFWSLPLFICCGSQPALRRLLQEVETRFPRFILSYVSDISRGSNVPAGPRLGPDFASNVYFRFFGLFFELGNLSPCFHLERRYLPGAGSSLRHPPKWSFLTLRSPCANSPLIFTIRISLFCPFDHLLKTFEPPPVLWNSFTRYHVIPLSLIPFSWSVPSPSWSSSAIRCFLPSLPGLDGSRRSVFVLPPRSYGNPWWASLYSRPPLRLFLVCFAEPLFLECVVPLLNVRSIFRDFCGPPLTRTVQCRPYSPPVLPFPLRSRSSFLFLLKINFRVSPGEVSPLLNGLAR